MSSELDLLVLKSLLNNKKHAIDFATEGDHKIFSPEVWNFATVILGYVKTYKDVPTLKVVVDRLSRGNNQKLIDTITNIWTEIDKLSYNDKEYKYNLDKLKKRFAEKQIKQVQESLSKFDPGTMDVSKAVKDMQQTIQSIKSLDHNKAYESQNIKEYLPQFVEKFNAKRENPELDHGLKTQYSFIDYATNGLKPADFLLIAGESGFGKSLFLNNIAVQVWLQKNKITDSNFAEGKDVIYFSLEMPYEDCFNRLLSRLSGVPSRSIENAKLTREEFNKVKQCLDFIRNYPYQFKIVDIADASANDLETILVDTDEKFDAAFIDYLGIMKPNEKSDEADWVKQGIVAYETRAIARKYSIPLFSAVQLNRKSPNKESGENIGLSRLARSGTIATHATHVIQIESRPNEEHYPDFVYHFIKNRKGPKGKGILIKNLSCATLLDQTLDDQELNEQFIDVDDISEEIERLEL